MLFGNRTSPTELLFVVMISWVVGHLSLSGGWPPSGPNESMNTHVNTNVYLHLRNPCPLYAAQLASIGKSLQSLHNVLCRC